VRQARLVSATLWLPGNAMRSKVYIAADLVRQAGFEPAIPLLSLQAAALTMRVLCVPGPDDIRPTTRRLYFREFLL
jgi:hypothetical protein